MVRFAFCSALIFASLSLLAANVRAQEYVCWNDDNGIRRCGDSFPPGQERFDRDVINNQGIRVGTQEGEITAEERAEMNRIRAEQEELQRVRDERRRYDEMLLQVYAQVTDIENLRDRRLEVMNSQVRLTEIYLTNLRDKLEGLMRRAERFAPYSDRDDAAPIPENLARDIDQTESSIEVREKTLQEIKATQDQMRLEFGRDIERFRQLKG